MDPSTPYSAGSRYLWRASHPPPREIDPVKTFDALLATSFQLKKNCQNKTFSKDFSGTNIACFYLMYASLYHQLIALRTLGIELWQNGRNLPCSSHGFAKEIPGFVWTIVSYASVWQRRYLRIFPVAQSQGFGPEVTARISAWSIFCPHHRHQGSLPVICINPGF